MGEICGYIGVGGVIEVGEGGGGVSIGFFGGKVGKLKKVVYVWLLVCDCYISCVCKSRRCLWY